MAPRARQVVSRRRRRRQVSADAKESCQIDLNSNRATAVGTCPSPVVEEAGPGDCSPVVEEGTLGPVSKPPHRLVAHSRAAVEPVVAVG